MGKKIEKLSPEAAEALRADVLRLASLKKKIKADIHTLVLEREALRDGIPISHPSITGDSLWSLIKKEAQPRIQKRWLQVQQVVSYLTYRFLTALRSFFESYDDGHSPSIASIQQKLTPIITSLGIMIRYAARRTEAAMIHIGNGIKANAQKVAAKIHAWQVELESPPSPKEPVTVRHAQPATVSFTLNAPSFLVSSAKSPAIQELTSRERLDRLLNTAYEDLMNQSQNTLAAPRA